MLTFRASDSVEKLRESVQSWLSDNPPPTVDSESSLETFVSVGRKWQEKLSSARWIGVHWPEQYGGRGLSLVEEAIVQEELGRVGAPQVLGLFGITMVGPVLIEHGTDAQKKRFLENILAAKEIWCQGFSEPGAGSDLVSLKTKAEPTKGGFLVTGQKIWTSFAHVADWCFLLARTSEEEKKHKGLTYLLVDMKQKGISVRPLRQITGDSEFNEVFFDEVFVPQENVVGAIGDGWRIAISTLMYERVVLTFARHLQSEQAIRGLLKRREVLSDDLRRKLVAEAVRYCAVRALAYKHLSEYTSGQSPGPEGSLDKLFWTQSFQGTSKLAFQSQGIKAAYGEQLEESGPDVHRYLYSRGRSIAAGTSEIQKNIIAERLLGLPKSR